MAKYSEETKAAAMAALLTGQSISRVAREYKIPKGTLSSWKNRGTLQNATQKKEIGTLVMEYLCASLETLKVQAEHFRNLKWLSKQSAESVAVLHGVMTDKVIRILEAYERDKDEAG